MKNNGRRVFRTILIVLFSAMFVFCGYKVTMVLISYSKADSLQSEVEEYKPAPVDDDVVVFPELEELRKINGDVFGWITIDGTHIDYPVVQNDNNTYYLKHTIKGDYSDLGSIFMDSRCKNDLSMFNSIIYGHRTNNKKMFADVREFRTKSYFDSHLTGTLVIENKKFNLETVALLIDNRYSILYTVDFEDVAAKQTHLQYIKDKAKYYREGIVDENDQILTLSTCTHEFNNARCVLIMKMVEA